MIKEGYPLSYAEGFDDGCHSGNKAGEVYLINSRRIQGGLNKIASTHKDGPMDLGNASHSRRRHSGKQEWQ